MTAPRCGSNTHLGPLHFGSTNPGLGRVLYFAYSVSRTPLYKYTKGGCLVRDNKQYDGK